MSDNQRAASSGLGLGSILTIIFVIAKIMDKIDWPWIWVFSPLWIPIGVALGVAAVFFTVCGLLFLLASVAEKISNAARSRQKPPASKDDLKRRLGIR